MDVCSLAEYGTMCMAFFLLAVLMPVNPPTSRMPKSFNEKDFQFCKYLRCVQVECCQVLRDIIRPMYASRQLRTRNGTMPIREFNMRANLDPDYKNMEDYLDSNIMEVDFDITFGNKILTEEHICGVFYKRLSEPCTNAIKFLVKERNKICHKYDVISDFQDDVSKLKTCIRVIYKESANILNVNFDANLQRTENNLDMIMQAEIQDDSSLSYIIDLEEFKQKKIFKMLNDGKEELCDYYGTLRTLNPCTWIDECDEAERFNLDKTFTPPKLWDAKYKGNIPMERLLTVEMKNKITPGMLLIQGLAGSGKTSLCRYFAHSWCKKLKTIKCLEAFDLVLLVEIRKCTSKNVLEYIREELLRNTCSAFKTEDLLMLQELDILILIDGYDEVSEVSKALVEDIFEKFYDKRFILTTRPELLHKTECIAKKHEIQYIPITLTGFDTSKQEEYSKKVFQAEIERIAKNSKIQNIPVKLSGFVDSKEEERCKALQDMRKSHESFSDYLSGRGRVLDKHLMLPLTIALLIVLWMDDPKTVNRITTATCLYQEIFNLCLKKLGERLISQKKSRGVKKLHTQLSSMLLYLGEKAWSMLLEGYGCVLSPTLTINLEERCNAKNVDAVEFFSAFLMCEKEFSGTTTTMKIQMDKKYSFLHKTQMEYLASVFLAQSIKDHSMDLGTVDHEIRKVSEWSRYREVLIYLTGNMAKMDILKGKEREIVRLAGNTGIESIDYCYWWKLVSESRIFADIPDSADKPIVYKNLVHPEIGKTITREHLSGKEDWDLDADNVAAGLRLMSLVNPIQFPVVSIVMNIAADKNPCKIPDFVNALSEAGQHWEKQVKKKKIKVEMHLKNHNEYGHDMASDNFLSALKTWADLQNFTGSLSQVANFSCFRTLKTIRCLVKDPQVLISFQSISKTVRSLRITLAFPTMICEPEMIEELNFDQDLELSFLQTKDEDLNWIISVVRRMSRSNLKCLHLEQSEVTYKGILQLVKGLNGILYHALYIRHSSLERQNDRQEDTLQRKANFRIDWCN